MRDLEFDLKQFAERLTAQEHSIAEVLRVSSSSTDELADVLAEVVRRNYVADTVLATAIASTGRTSVELVEAKLPDPGSVMSGDFGEILTGLVQAARRRDPLAIRDPKKLRLKAERTKAAHYSDVVQFETPHWPEPSEKDKILCAEVKAKATDGGSDPIGSAVRDSKLDRDGRLAKTLVWLRERALFTDLGTVSVEVLDRFINAIDHPPVEREFFAVAVICSDLADTELDAVATAPVGCTLVVIIVPHLKETYESVYERAADSLDKPDPA